MPTLFIIIAIAFFMIRLAPGGPFDRERVVPPENLGQPETASTISTSRCRNSSSATSRVSRGGISGRPSSTATFTVTELIATGFPVSMKIGLLAMVVAVFLGVGLGAWAAQRRKLRSGSCGHGHGHDRHRGSQLRRSAAAVRSSSACT